jgi:uncharacterized protein YraI
MSNSPKPNPFPLPAIIGIAALALIGVGFLALAAFTLVRSNLPGPVASQTRIITQVALIPTTTQSPPTATLEPTTAPTTALTVATPASSTPASTLTTTVTQTVSIVVPANVRTGPGTTYPVVGGLNAGSTAPVVGRDSSAQWFAITYDGAPQGQGWVSVLVASFSGNINDLPVIQASAPPPATSVPPTNVPPPTNAPPAATNTPTTSGANGIQTLNFQMPQTTGTVNQSMWFTFTVVNTTSSVITYGILAAHTDQGVTADSWHEPLQPGRQLTWTDHINFGTAGTYQVYLGICFSSHDACKASAPWVRLSNSVTVTIQ